ncbi:3,4-dihydroxy-2-butanone-4-phosphate synthase [Halegenticoccus tardaugens]|uniref:3,4-dihydroxy-2-butanone-4-phosphate synthase n=1 Tax=Halegenticoccus tardaugens TaxID=2071624 RepID=UPI0037430B65
MFDTPGHVHLLKAAPNLLEDRQGHTDLGVALAELARIPPAVVVCEMLDNESGGALSPTNAASYAKKCDFVFLEGRPSSTKSASDRAGPAPGLILRTFVARDGAQRST